MTLASFRAIPAAAPIPVAIWPTYLASFANAMDQTYRFINTILANFDVNLSRSGQSRSGQLLKASTPSFTRELKARRTHARMPIHSTLLLPADGKVSQCGKIVNGRIFPGQRP